MFFKKKSIVNKCEICEMISNNIDVFKICENNLAISYLDKNPLSNGHSIVASKKHYQDLSLADDLAIKAVFSLTKYTANKIFSNINEIKDISFVFNEKSIAGQKYNHFYINIVPQYDQSNIIIEKKNNWLDKIDITYEKIMKSK